MDFLVKIFKALANSNRIELLYILRDGEKEISDIARKLRLPYKTVARDLKILERTNLILSRRWKGVVYYSLMNEGHFEYNKVLFNLIEKRYERSKK